MIIGEKINSQTIASLIPHSGSMCLIEQVGSWDNESIICRSSTHRNLDNPLRMNNQLSAIHLLEYGAQAIAIHGGLLTKTTQPGFLAAIRNAVFYCERIDTLDSEIIIHAKAEVNTEKGAIYNFGITASDLILVEAYATVINV